MGPILPAASRRGILTAAAAGSVLALAAPTAAQAKPVALVARDRLGSALTLSPAGRRVSLRYAPDFHERLSDWLRFWWANAPAHWIAPFEVQTAGTTSDGQAFLLTGITYTRADRRLSGFDAGNRDSRYWATVASLFHHFGTVKLAGSHIRVEDGHAGFTGSTEQAAFIRTAQDQVWAGVAPSDITSRSGWAGFTRATLRRGLNND